MQQWATVADCANDKLFETRSVLPALTSSVGHAADVPFARLFLNGQCAKMFAEEYLNRVPLSQRRQQELNRVASNARAHGQLVIHSPTSGKRLAAKNAPDTRDSEYEDNYTSAADTDTADMSSDVALPKWLALVDPASQHTYWENQETYETQWEEPYGYNHDAHAAQQHEAGWFFNRSNAAPAPAPSSGSADTEPEVLTPFPLLPWSVRDARSHQANTHSAYTHQHQAINTSVGAEEDLGGGEAWMSNGEEVDYEIPLSGDDEEERHFHITTAVGANGTPQQQDEVEDELVVRGSSYHVDVDVDGRDVDLDADEVGTGSGGLPSPSSDNLPVATTSNGSEGHQEGATTGADTHVEEGAPAAGTENHEATTSPDTDKDTEAGGRNGNGNGGRVDGDGGDENEMYDGSQDSLDSEGPEDFVMDEDGGVSDLDAGSDDSYFLNDVQEGEDSDREGQGARAEGGGSKSNRNGYSNNGSMSYRLESSDVQDIISGFMTPRATLAAEQQRQRFFTSHTHTDSESDSDHHISDSDQKVDPGSGSGSGPGSNSGLSNNKAAAATDFETRLDSKLEPLAEADWEDEHAGTPKAASEGRGDQDQDQDQDRCEASYVDPADGEGDQSQSQSQSGYYETEAGYDDTGSGDSSYYYDDESPTAAEQGANGNGDEWAELYDENYGCAYYYNYRTKQCR